MINLRKVVNTIYIGIRDIHPRYIKLLYFYISYIEFHIFVYPPIIGKRIPVSPLPVFVFLFHPRMSHIFFLIFRKPRALSTDETRPWKRDRTRNKGVPRKNCDFQAERRRLVSPRKRTVLFRNRRFQPPLSPEFLNPMPAIMVGAKNADTVLSSAKKRAGNVNFIYSIQFPRARPSKGWPTFISSDFFFSFPFFRGEERIDGRSL